MDDDGYEPVDPDDYVVHPERGDYSSLWQMYGAAAFMTLAGVGALVSGNGFGYIPLGIGLIVLVFAVRISLRHKRPG